MELKEMNLYQRMSAITSEMKAVGKNLEIDMGSGKTYKAVSERDVLDKIKPLEEKYGIYSYPFDRSIAENKVIVTVGKYGEKQQLFLRLETIYRFVNIDVPSEFIDIKTYGDGVDSQDKAPGKAMTYADKYALLKAYKVATGEDTDQEASQELKTFTDKIEEQKVEYETLTELTPLLTIENIDVVKKYYKISDLSDLTQKQALDMIAKKKAKK